MLSLRFLNLTELIVQYEDCKLYDPILTEFLLLEPNEKHDPKVYKILNETYMGIIQQILQHDLHPKIRSNFTTYALFAQFNHSQKRNSKSQRHRRRYSTAIQPHFGVDVTPSCVNFI